MSAERVVIADRYELTAFVGRGGMGEVWEAYDRGLDRKVAVKLLRRDTLPETDRGDDVGERRFHRETRATARVEYPGVPAVYDTGVHEDTLFLVMQFIEGHLLSDVIAEEAPMPVPWVASITAQLASILAAAHDRSLVHRDLKPGNIILGPDGSLKLLDFGIAAVLDPGTTRLTMGVVPGTPHYMAPEQLEDKPATPRSDLYSLGCLMYELLTERPPSPGARSRPSRTSRSTPFPNRWERCATVFRRNSSASSATSSPNGRTTVPTTPTPCTGGWNRSFPGRATSRPGRSTTRRGRTSGRWPRCPNGPSAHVSAAPLRRPPGRRRALPRPIRRRCSPRPSG
ncbi:serine/threonine protein kinase [Spinactinospora alkalitolerans]|uniref:Serine/threonine protein kinase n=1 Tax=Spinactinospora alkalitolerans TaxID=687207 RepID=A0A852U2M6_9ACTN|nr:serine/threonine-protein kinase [Spinactinospora alkalitolerans]NYE50391.1 serine/threonine protein kinase [Spinactinospora alkalitolerans]